jgi:hypothetical protein
MNIIVSVASIKPVIEMIEVDLGQDAPVDSRTVLKRINGMISEAFDCLLPNGDVIAAIERMLMDNELDDDELLFVAPEVYLLERLLEEIRCHPFTNRQSRKLRHITVIGVFGDLILHYQ